jgi:hypothetical protein
MVATPNQDIERSEPDLRESNKPFWNSLAATIAWCMPKVDVTTPGTCLRTAHTRPRLFTRGYFDTVSEALRHRYPRPKEVPMDKDLERGRLLVYFPDLDLCDGAAEAESRGFLDVNNAPPWDTWIAMIADRRAKCGPCLIAWVPPEFLQLADAGVQVNPEECVKWLDADAIAMCPALQAFAV